VMIAISFGVSIFLHLHQLVVQVDEGTVRYKFFPYFSGFRSIIKENVEKLYVRKYRPIWEFGGWGYRIRLGGKAFNIVGNWGLQIHFKNGKQLLIGTQKPKELDKAIDQLKSNWGKS